MKRWNGGAESCRRALSTESDQFQIPPAASQEILHHTVWRIWLFIAYSGERWIYYQFSLPLLYIGILHFQRKRISDVVRIGSQSSFIWISYEKPSSSYCVLRWNMTMLPILTTPLILIIFEMLEECAFLKQQSLWEIPNGWFLKLISNTWGYSDMRGHGKSSPSEAWG